jgi:two-component system OmpR family sensor kinase/two-component system sensor histidine kinase QseC
LNSLRLRLLVLLGTLAAAAALTIGGATYFSVRSETDALFDYLLRQMALSLRDQGRIPDQERAALQGADFDYVVQIWSMDGVELYSTLPASPLPPRAVLGFSTVEVSGVRWRMFSAATPLRVVQVAQPLATRSALAAAAAWRSVLPIAWAAPLVALAVWALVAASLAPLSRLVAELRQRDARALEPLSESGLPGEVAPLVQAFNALLGRLALAFGAQRAFVADAAHELRSPLTALKLQIGLLRQAGDAAEREAATVRLQAGIERAAHLVEQLLALARADPAAAVVHAPLDLAEVVRLALADSLPLAGERDGSVELDADGPLLLHGDAQALRSLVRNLVDNALVHGGASPHVQVSLMAESDSDSEGGAAVLRVDDHGPGIPEAERVRVFDRFRRLIDRAPGSGQGSGLGLAIVRSIAAQHGGSVRLADAPGGGLRAEVRLPLKRAP